MREGKKLLIDIDGVIRDILPSILSIYNCQYNDKIGKTYTKKDITEFDFRHSLKNIRNIDTFFQAHSRDIFYYSNPVEKSLASLKSLHKDYNITLITANPYRTGQRNTLEWLEMYDVRYDDLIFTTDKSIVKGEVALDDAVHNLLVMNANKKVCMDRPYNKRYKGHRVKDMEQFENFVREYVK